jgi:nitroreductase
MKRRTFLAGSALVAASIAGAKLPTAFGKPKRGKAPRLSAEPIDLVRSAILASNTFNSQPWLFKIGRTRIDLYADFTRALGAFDPYCRDLVLSLGCALENLVLAAAAAGYRTRVTLPPAKLSLQRDPEPRLVARLNLEPAEAVADPLFDAIPHRHTNRNPFDSRRPLPDDFTTKLVRLAAADMPVRMFVFTGAAEREELAEISLAAGKSNFADPNIVQAMRPWLRSSEQQWRQSGDGELVQEPPSPMPYKQLLLTGRLFGLIAVRDRYDQPQTVQAGRIWQRAHLLATTRGIAARPENSAVQLIDHERRLERKPACAARLARLTGDPQWQPSHLFYMGYALAPPLRAPRRPIEQVEL